MIRSALRILGALVFVVGAIGLLYPELPTHLDWTYEYKTEQLGGPLGITAHYRRHVTVPLWASTLVTVAGLALILIPAKKR